MPGPYTVTSELLHVYTTVELVMQYHLYRANILQVTTCLLTWLSLVELNEGPDKDCLSNVLPASRSSWITKQL